MMHEREKSDPAVVAVKPVNAAERSAAESVEPRAGAEGMRASTARTEHRNGQPCHRALERHTASSKAKDRGEVHHAPAPHQHRSPRTSVPRTQEDAPPGVDGLRWRDYEADLEHNLEGLHCTGPSRSVTGHCLAGGSTYPSRTAANAR